jgi:hypothetical protein
MVNGALIRSDQKMIDLPQATLSLYQKQLCTGYPQVGPQDLCATRDAVHNAWIYRYNDDETPLSI